MVIYFHIHYLVRFSLKVKVVFLDLFFFAYYKRRTPHLQKAKIKIRINKNSIEKKEK